MNKEELQKNITKYLKKLPQEALDIFSSMQWINALKNIELNYNLNEEQVEILGVETSLVLLGIIHIEEYKEIIESEIDLEKEVANKIYTELYKNFIENNKDQLLDVFQSNALDLAEEKYGGSKNLSERFSALPKEVQTAIRESDYQIALYEVAKNYELNVGEIGLLEEVTTKVMLGIIHPDKYEAEIISKIKTPGENVSNLVKEVNEKILNGIKKPLKKYWEESNSKVDQSNIQQVVSNKGEDMVIKNEDKIITDYQLPITNKETIINEKKVEEDEVPKPPYEVIKNEELIIKNEKGGEKELIKNEVTKEVLSVPVKPVQEVKSDVFENKLNGSVTGGSNVSEYSSKTPDPYREAF